MNTGNWSDLACNASFIHLSSFKLVNTLGISYRDDEKYEARVLSRSMS